MTPLVTSPALVLVLVQPATRLAMTGSLFETVDCKRSQLLVPKLEYLQQHSQLLQVFCSQVCGSRASCAPLLCDCKFIAVSFE